MTDNYKTDDDDQVLRSSWYDYGNRTMKGSDDFEKCSNSTNSSFGESMVSNGSLSESHHDTADDASSSFSFSSNNSNGSLYDLSEIMAQLPIKKGLSKFYQGKSESFTSLSRVTSIQDLAKKTPPFRKNLKSSKSFGNGLNRYKPYTLSNSTTKKSMTGS